MLLDKRVIDSLKTNCKGVFGNEDPLNWADITTVGLIKELGYREPPVNIFDVNLLKKRNVLRASTKKHLPVFGKLSIEENGFVIEINQNNLIKWIRYNLAHEVAHTFFFDINTWPPRRLTSLRSSNEP